MKNKNTILTLLLLLVACTLSSCVSDGDETISLEYGNPKKMIIGKWILDKSYVVYSDGRRVEENTGNMWYQFYNDGTYTTSDDKNPKKWRLGTNSDNAPYYGNINLDGEDYEIVSLGGDENGDKGRWILGQDETNDKTRYWELNKTEDFEDDEPSIPDSPGGKGKLVSRVEVGFFSDTETKVVQTIDFLYDNNNRVISAIYRGEEEVVIGPMGYQIYYNINDDRLTLSTRAAGSTDKPINLNGVPEDKGPYGTINSQGYLTYDCFENSQEELNSGDYFSVWYEYNSKGETIQRSCGTAQSSDYSFTYIWEDGNITNGPSNDDIYYRGNIENKANIDLNKLSADQIFDEDIFGLALCGYKGIKDKYLIVQMIGLDPAKFDYEYDNEGYPIYIRRWDIPRHNYNWNADCVMFKITYTE